MSEPQETAPVVGDAFAELVGRPRRTGEHRIIYDPVQHVEWLEARQARDAARTAADRANLLKTNKTVGASANQATKDLAAAEKALTKIEDGLQYLTFRFQSLGDDAYTRLAKQHRAVDDDGAEVSPPEIDHEAFAPALAEASIFEYETPSGAVGTTFTATMWQTMRESGNYPGQEFVDLYSAMLAINVVGATMQSAGKGSRTTRRSR